MRTIKAYVGKDMLSVVDRLFQADLQSVVSELTQNSRRAGATELRIDVEPDEVNAGKSIVTLADNGSGMAEPDELLGLRASGWTDAKVLDEDPAGMGFFVLSGLPWAEVRSGDWKMTLTRESFKGADVLVEPASSVRGMRVRFPQTTSESITRDNLRHGMDSFFALCGLTVFRDDKLVTQREYLTAPERAQCLKESYDDLGVDAIAYTTPRPYDLHSYASGSNFRFNFFGFAGACSMPAVPDVTVMVNIRHAKHIKPVLPARKDLVTNDALVDLTARLEKLAYRLVAGEHALAYRHYTRAQELGINIGEPRKRLIRVAPDSQTSVLDLTAAACLIGRPDRHGEWQNSAGAYMGASALSLYCKHAAYKGYAWYDALPVVRAVRLKVDGLELAEEAPDEDADSVILWDDAPPRGDLTMEFDIEANGETVTHTAALDVMLRPEGEREECPGSISTFIVDNSATADNVDDIVDVLEAAWMPQEWSEEDGTDYWRHYVKSKVAAIITPTDSMDYGARLGMGAAEDAVLYPNTPGLTEGRVQIALTKDIGSHRWRYSWASMGVEAGQAAYRMLVTRATQETVVLELEAPDLKTAAEMATKMASSGEDCLTWAPSGEPTYLATREDAPRSKA